MCGEGEAKSEKEKEKGVLNEIQWGLWALVEFRKLRRIVYGESPKNKSIDNIILFVVQLQELETKQVNNLTSNAQQSRLI